MNRIKIEIVDYKKHSSDIKNIRFTVFVEEQKVPEELEIDEYDKIATHILLYVDDKPVGTGRILLEDGHIGRIAVLKEYRKKHFGTMIMWFLVEKAREQNLDKVWLSAQLAVVDFYRRLGFIEYGKTFWDAGIKHINMEKRL